MSGNKQQLANLINLASGLGSGNTVISLGTDGNERYRPYVLLIAILLGW